jgi:hypothetical protein
MSKAQARMTLAAAAFLMALPLTKSHAAVIGVYDGNAASPGGYTWTYRVSLPERARVAPGDFLTIYDFGGFTGTHSQPAGWTFLSPLTGPVPVLIDVPVDNPLVPNLTWRYDGTTITTTGDLGDFLAESSDNLRVDGWFASQGTRNDGGPLDGTPISNLAIIPVPLALEPSVPEPATVGLLAVGMIGMLRRRR